MLCIDKKEKLPENIFPVPFAERDTAEWVVLASGPNNAGWQAYAEEKKANIFCVNGSIMLCSNPSAYVCLDPAAITLFEDFRKGLSEETEILLGDEALKKKVGTFLIDGMKVRTIAIWALYLICKFKQPKRIALFGVYGADKEGEWSTLSTLEGKHNLLDMDSFYVYQKAFKQAGNTAAKRIQTPLGRPQHSNLNTAALIRKIRIMFPQVAIDLKGGGPVSDLLESPYFIEQAEEQEYDHAAGRALALRFPPVPLIQPLVEAIKQEKIKPLWMLNYKKYKKSDTVFLLGSGPSINELTDEHFRLIAQHDSIGINMWSRHSFVPTFYQCESPDSEGLLLAEWHRKAGAYSNVPVIFFDCMKESPPLEKMPVEMLSNLHVAETYYIPGDSKTRLSYEVSLRAMREHGFFADHERLRIISRRRASGSFCLSLALQMGYKKIILLGFDLYKMDYFHDFEQLKKPAEVYASQDTSSGVAVSTILEAMVLAVAKPLGVQVFIGSTKSALYPFLPLFTGE